MKEVILNNIVIKRTHDGIVVYDSTKNNRLDLFHNDDIEEVTDLVKEYLSVEVKDVRPSNLRKIKSRKSSKSRST